MGGFAVSSICIVWRDPSQELPAPDQKIFAMLNPHKVRGSLLDSACSIQIISGWYHMGRIENYDEYGWGSQAWKLDPRLGPCDDQEEAIAWIPVEEMPFPQFELIDRWQFRED